MRVLLCLLLVASCASANKIDNRGNKLPFVADAVGNTLPPPSNVPATVGSPVNLLTPDRYEFYTFDESGELVKRLMTLEEIQAIVAAGEDTEGLVTFSNDNQPTVAFNVNPPPYTKVHSVVENVQNVLKAQMEVHKNKPLIHPTLDTPDVSNSWSLILPSIFGNTGVDIIPDKSSGAVTTPDTVTLEEQDENDENSLSKEGDRVVLGSSTTKDDVRDIVIEKAQDKTTEVPTTKMTITSTFGTTTSTPKPYTTTNTAITTTKKPVTITTLKPSHNTTTTRPSTIVTQTKITYKPYPSTTNATTSKPFIKTTTKITTPSTDVTTNKYMLSISNIPDNEKNYIEIQPHSNTVSNTENHGLEFEKISTFIPVSTATYVTKHTTQKPISSTKPTSLFISTTKRSVASSTTLLNRLTVKPLLTTNKEVVNTLAVSTPSQQNDGNVNLTTITTQSVSPSATVSSTEILTFNKVHLINTVENKPNFEDSSFTEKYDETLPLFDVAQSISQIASDLGGNYAPIPTTSALLNATNIVIHDLESKENIDIDIPSGIGNETNIKTQGDTVQNNDNFVKISTIDPHNKNESKQTDDKNSNSTIKYKEQQNQNEKVDMVINTVQKVEFTSTTSTSESTTFDPILFESMGDLMSQVVNEAPSIISSETKNNNNKGTTSTTEKFLQETSEKVTDKITPSTTETLLEITSVKQSTTEDLLEVISDKSTDKALDLTTEKSLEITSEKETIILEENNSVAVNNSNKRTDISHKEKIDAIVNLNNNGSIDNNKTFIVNEQSLVQELVFSDKIDKEIESITKNENKDNSTTVVSNIKENISQKPELITITEDTIFSMPVTKDIPSVEKTTILPELNISEPTSAIKLNKSSSINKSNSKESIPKKEKLPELLPKVDDYKKKIQKVNIEDEELISERNNTWKLIPTLSPPKANEIPKDKVKSDSHFSADNNYNKDIVLDYSSENQGLEVTTKNLEEDVARFTELFNELAFRYWNVIIEDIDKRRSFVFSPYSTFSMLAMIFMGARGATSGEMNEILKLDDMVTFNPHFTLRNISDSIETSAQSGVAVSAFIRELYSDRNKGKILTFYKERAQHFYNGHVEEVNFKLISDIIRRRTNLLVKRYTWGKISEYMKTNNIVMQPPLAAFTANIFQTDCSGTSVDGRDGEMYFVVSPNVRQRRLVPVPAVVYKKGFLAGYDPVLDVTVAALGNTNSIISTLFLMPGQQGNVVHADDLEKLEQRLLENESATQTWNRVLRSLLPRVGLELQIPRFSHKSTFNATSTLKKMGLKDIFNGEHADLGGLNGPSKDLYLSDMIQLNTFVTCGEGAVGEQHHIEEYPENVGVTQKRRARWLNDWDEPRDYQRAFHDPHDFSDVMHLPLHLRPRQARLPARSTQPARLKYDRPFLYFVRHNPTGMILYFGRYNPRLLP